MFKKMHSNRNPEDTVFSEIKKEFGHYFNKLDLVITAFLRKHPLPIFICMLGLIVVSFVLSFTVFRQTTNSLKSKKGAVEANSQPSTEKVLGAATSGFDRILTTGAALRETIAIKKEIDSITNKKEISAEDGAKLEKALYRLEQLDKSLK